MIEAGEASVSAFYPRWLFLQIQGILETTTTLPQPNENGRNDAPVGGKKCFGNEIRLSSAHYQHPQLASRLGSLILTDKLHSAVYLEVDNA